MARFINFTKKNIEEIQIPQVREEYQDNKIPELRFRVTASGTKSYSVYKRLPGSKPVRVTLGKYPAISPSRARALALQKLAMLSEGINPNEKERVEAVSKITLQEVFNKYIEFKELKPKTLYGYKSAYKCHLSSLGNKCLKDIKRDTVLTVHRSISSKAQADLTMRLLRALFNFARLEWVNEEGLPIFSDNPVEILSHRKQWHHVDKRHTHLRPKEIPIFISALVEIRNRETITGQSICDSMLFALLTGLRRNEIFNLKWIDVDFTSAVFTVQKTKNGQKLELPLTPSLRLIFKRSRKRIITPYVFGAENKYGQIREPKKVVGKIKAATSLNCDFHDLRRIFATTAEQNAVGVYKLKRLMNHATGRDDVTAGYTILTAETLRSSLDKIQASILKTKQ